MGQRVGKYEIVERIGRGAMGVVYKAHDPVLARAVALKVISDEVEITGELRARFFREAQACAKLSHPNIVTIHDMGEADGRLFIVMELVQGQELRQVIAQRRRMTLEEKLDLMIQVCAGLHYAHARGVVHRDVKPANIIVQADGVPKLLDFGIARLGESGEGLTRTGLVMGSLRYVAPEQASGHADARSDMFSAAAVFFELLSHRTAFPATDPIQLLEQLRSEDPPPLTDLEPDIPARVSAVVQRALRKAPADRFADMGQMRAELQAALRQRAAEALQVKNRLDAALARGRSLQAALVALAGSTGDPEPLADADEDDGLSGLLTAERLVLEAIARLEDRLSRARAAVAQVDLGEAYLAAGRARAAVTELEAALAELPNDDRAAAALTDARRALEDDSPTLSPDGGAIAVLASGMEPPSDGTVFVRRGEHRPSSRSPLPDQPAPPRRRRPIIGIATALAAAFVIAAGLYWMKSAPRAATSPPEPGVTERQPDGVGRAQSASPPAREDGGAAPEPTGGATPEPTATPAPGAAPAPSTQLAPVPHPAPPNESVSLPPREQTPSPPSAAAEPPVRARPEARPSSVMPVTPDARAASPAPRSAEDVRELQARVREVRRAAEFVDARALIPELWAKAHAAEQEGESALDRGDVRAAATHFRSAERAYRAAAGAASEQFESDRQRR